MNPPDKGAERTEGAVLKFKVTEALSKDVGRAIARMGPQDLEKLHVAVGDLVEVAGKRGTVCKAMPAHKELRSQGFDLTFDRVVLEKMMDLAPPGLDEIMALARIMEFLARDSFDLFVLDCAPTGHLIRLLELPDLINQWLKAFFNLFLKYERILKLPGFADELVGLSRNLKRLRELLQDPARSVLYAVSIPTRMALEETRDLLAACDRMGMAVPLVFLNLMTPPGDCQLCSRLHERELVVAESFRQIFQAKHQTLVYRQPEIAGLERLEEFGRSLYEPARQELVTQ